MTGAPTFTPGPWGATLNNYDVDLRQWTIRDTDGGYVADVRNPCVDYDMAVDRAADPNCRMPHDARLIAAAPALYEALKAALPAIHAAERLGDIKHGSYPRKAEEAQLHAIVDAFCDIARAALAATQEK